MTHDFEWNGNLKLLKSNNRLIKLIYLIQRGAHSCCLKQPIPVIVYVCDHIFFRDVRIAKPKKTHVMNRMRIRFSFLSFFFFSIPWAYFCYLFSPIYKQTQQ